MILQESHFKKPAQKLNTGTIDQSAAWIQHCSQSKQSKAEDEFSAGKFSCLELLVTTFTKKGFRQSFWGTEHFSIIIGFATLVIGKWIERYHSVQDKFLKLYK